MKNNNDFVYSGNEAIDVCKGCTVETGRHTSCHDTCKRYADAIKAHQKRKAQIDKETMVYKYNKRKYLRFNQARAKR